jgi:hypothetical protein
VGAGILDAAGALSKGGNEFSLRSPFDLMVNRATYSSWLVQ